MTDRPDLAALPGDQDRSMNRGILRAALIHAGYTMAQADTRIIEFEREVRESSPVEELRRLCEQYGLTLSISYEEAAAQPASCTAEAPHPECRFGNGPAKGRYSGWRCYRPPQTRPADAPLGRWSRQGWHTQDCWQQWAADPESDCSCLTAESDAGAQEPSSEGDTP